MDRILWSSGRGERCIPKRKKRKNDGTNILKIVNTLKIMSKGYNGPPMDFEDINEIQIKAHSILKFKRVTHPYTGAQSLFIGEAIHTEQYSSNHKGPTIPLLMLQDVLQVFTNVVEELLRDNADLVEDEDEFGEKK